jgi:CspA family cold shock protein
MKGNVKWFNNSKGYGFIVDEQGKQYFVHWKSILSQTTGGRKELVDGEVVEFDISTTDKGDQAINVVPLKR